MIINVPVDGLAPIGARHLPSQWWPGSGSVFIHGISSAQQIPWNSNMNLLSLLECLFNSLIRLLKISKLRVSGIWVESTGEPWIPSQMASYHESLSMPWYHHAFTMDNSYRLSWIHSLSRALSMQLLGCIKYPVIIDRFMSNVYCHTRLMCNRISSGMLFTPQCGHFLSAHIFYVSAKRSSRRQQKSKQCCLPSQWLYVIFVDVASFVNVGLL